MGGGSVKKELEKSQTTLEAATIDLQAKIEENGNIFVPVNLNVISQERRMESRLTYLLHACRKSSPTTL